MNNDTPDPMIRAIADLLEKSGHSPEEALTLAREATQRSRTVSEGCGYGHLHPEGIDDLWTTAARHGKRRVVLEITAEGETWDEVSGRVDVRVIETETWLDWQERPATWPEVMQGLAPTFQQRLNHMTDRLNGDIQDRAEKPAPEELN